MLGQCVVSAPFMLATAETGESPDLAGKKAQTLLMAKEGDTACLVTMLNLSWMQKEDSLWHEANTKIRFYGKI